MGFDDSPQVYMLFCKEAYTLAESRQTPLQSSRPEKVETFSGRQASRHSSRPEKVETLSGRQIAMGFDVSPQVYMLVHIHLRRVIKPHW